MTKKNDNYYEDERWKPVAVIEFAIIVLIVTINYWCYRQCLEWDV